MIRSEIEFLVDELQPFDNEEADHIAFVQKWIASGADIFRIAKPATPNPHLVAYFLLIDQDQNRLLLVEHKKANLWIPAGGHVEIDEHPKKTVQREIVEELGIQADFLSEKPFFLTVTQTAGPNDEHTDVSLWYMLKASVTTPLLYDEGEFHRIRWFAPHEIPFHQSDPHMYRLIQKLALYNMLDMNLSQ